MMWAFGAGVVAVGALALLAVLVLYLVARGPARAGLASAGVAAALTGPVAGVAAASWLLTESLKGMAMAGSSMAAALGACAEAATLIRVGCASGALILLVSALLGWLGRGHASSLPAASSRRLLALALPALLAPLLVGGAFDYSRRTRDIVMAVITLRPGAELAPPLPSSLAEVARRISSGVTIGTAGAPLLLLVLTGFASATAILAWRVRVSAAFAAVLSAWMLLQALLWTAAMFLFRTSGFSPGGSGP